MTRSINEDHTNQNSDWEFLREDLVLLAGPTSRNGSPTWSLQDPSSGKFFRIGILEFEILKRWGLRNASHIIRDIHASTVLRPSLEDIQNLYKFLKASHLLRTYSAEHTKSFLEFKSIQKSQISFQSIFKNYFFFRINLIKPDRLLTCILPYCRFLFTSLFTKIAMLSAIVGAFLVLRDFDEFLLGFQKFQNFSGLIAVFVALAFAKILHEFGHAITCKYYKCHVPAMGIAFIVMWPILWTDTTDAWRLKKRKKRLAIDGAGIVTELTIAAFASILWAVLPYGALKDAMHVLAGVTWIMTLFVNLNPFMRFDGYYLLSDALDFPNLQDRSFKIARAKLRYMLWGIREPDDENLSSRFKSGLCVYAYATWIYRFFLFLGIALIIYYFFFKALGVLLMAIQLWYFIVRPVINEIRYWFTRKDDMQISKTKQYTFFALLVFAVILLVVPWQSRVQATAILKSSNEVPLVAGIAGQLSEVLVQSGQTVSKGDPLFIMRNADLSFEQKQAVLRKQVLTQELKSKSIDLETYREAVMVSDQLKKQISEINLTTAEQKLLTIYAPIDGVVVDIPDFLSHGQWIANKEVLGLVHSDESLVEAFVQETDLHRIGNNAPVIFYSDFQSQPLKGVIRDIDSQASKHIPYPELGSNFGGQIVMRNMPSKDNRMVPESRYYKVTISLEDGFELEQTQPGSVYIEADNQSIFISIWRRLKSILIQESGF